jgi:apolipoprotein N-acyltransferase
MASAPDLRRAVAAALAVALTAVLTWCGTGLHPWWPLLWLAPLPVLVFAAGAPWWRAAIVAAIAWLGGMLGLWHDLHDALPVPAIVFVQLCGIESLVFTLGVLLYRALLLRGAYRFAVIAFPAVRVAFEYLVASGGPHGTFGSLAYTQVGSCRCCSWRRSPDRGGSRSWSCWCRRHWPPPGRCEARRGGRCGSPALRSPSCLWCWRLA